MRIHPNRPGQTSVLLKLFLLLLSLPVCAIAQSPVGDVVGQVTLGYQGWFSAGEPSPPDNISWDHWTYNSQYPTPGAVNNFVNKQWPDMRPYQTLAGDNPMQYATGYGKFGNGLPATLFTSYNRDVVDIHMKWVAKYGIHTLAIGRFNPTGGTAATVTAANVLATAPKYGVKFYISYDLSGWTGYTTQLPNDWTNVIEGQLHMTSSPNYARQNGKPVVELWIANLVPHTTPQEMAGIISWLENQGLYVILGVEQGWRANDTWVSTYMTGNMIQPWMIGVIGNKNDTDGFVSKWKDDVAYANGHSVDFQAAILPGDDSASAPQRRHGDFMWEQFANATTAGVKSAFISMYDEFGEGNAVMPTAEDASMTPGVTAALDVDGTHCSSDYYMRLTGDGGKMLQGLVPLTYTRSTQPVIPVRNLVPGTIVTFQAMANGMNVTAENAGAGSLVANRTAVGSWEGFQVVDAGGGNIALKSLANNLFVTAEDGGNQPLIANRAAIGPWETFTEFNTLEGNTALLAKANGRYVTADEAGSSPLIANRTAVGPWETLIVTMH